jgi:hypothetical protein
MPSDARTGRCLCGATRYAIATAPLLLYACHCTHCQTVSGASFTLTLVAETAGIASIEGAAQPYDRPQPSGGIKTIFRCPRCLTALWGVRPDRPAIATVYAGTLDDSKTLVPAAHIWTRSAQPWIPIPDGVYRHEMQPADMAELLRAAKAPTG